MAGISSKAAGKLENRKGYNGIEYENSFDINIGEAFFRTHDPQIGRWLQIDPKLEATISLSPYVAMNNNPISLSDPLGDIVKYDKDEGVKRKEFRAFKREVRMLRNNSSTFNKMYKEFKRDKHVTYNYIARASDKGGGTEVSKDGKTVDIGVGIRSDESKSGGSRNHFATQLGLISHETGHAWRIKHGSEPAFPSSPNLPRPSSPMDQFNNNRALLSYMDNMVSVSHNRELGASHIENIVLSEVMNSGNARFNNVDLRASYYGALEIKSEMANGRATKVLTPTAVLNTLPNGRSHYLNNRFDIFKEFNIQPSSNE